MNWVCEFCGYENEYNDESQPTECLCCGEPASEHLLNQARHALEKYHKEQERQRRLEQLRQEAIKRQEKIEHSVSAFVKSVKGIAPACIVSVILAIVITGFNVYKGNITPEYIGVNIKNITVMDNAMISAKTISEHLSGNALEFRDNIVPNVSFTTKSRDYSVMANPEVLVEEKGKSMTGISMMVKRVGDNCKVGYENIKKNIVVSENNVTNGFGNFMNNCKLFWMQATKNINRLVDDISMKIGRSK